MFYPESISDGARRLAVAIAEMRWIQHSRYIRSAEAWDVVSLAGGDTIAAYKLVPALRKSFPYLEQIVTGQTPNGGYVYLIHDQQGHYKIGRSVNVDKRVKQLRTQPPFELDVIASAWVADCKEEEKLLHSQYREHRLKGEWFALPDSSVESICHAMGRIQQGVNRASRAYAEFDPSEWMKRRNPHGAWHEKDAVQEGYDF